MYDCLVQQQKVTEKVNIGTQSGQFHNFLKIVAGKGTDWSQMGQSRQFSQNCLLVPCPVGVHFPINMKPHESWLISTPSLAIILAQKYIMWQ